MRLVFQTKTRNRLSLSTPRSVLRLVLAFGLVAGIALVVFWLAVSEGVNEAAPGSPVPSRNPVPEPGATVANRNAPQAGSVNASVSQRPPAEVVGPAEKPIAGDVGPERIAGIASSQEAAQVHRVLTRQLVARLEELTAIRDRERIRVAIQELAERFYLLDRAVKVRQLAEPGADSLDRSDAARIEALRKVWQANLDLSLTVDQLFRERGLLRDEHVSSMLRRWMREEGGREAGP